MQEKLAAAFALLFEGMMTPPADAAQAIDRLQNDELTEVQRATLSAFVTLSFVYDTD